MIVVVCEYTKVFTWVDGNVEILKHSSICLDSALKLEDAFAEAGFPEGVFQCVVGNSTVGESLIKSDIDAISVTRIVNT